METTELLSNIYTKAWSHPGADLEFTLQKAKDFVSKSPGSYLLTNEASVQLYMHSILYSLPFNNNFIFYGPSGMLLIGEQTD